jgi:hypothetical protein
MALWGKNDSKTASGTIAINATTGAVTGTSTAFTTQAKVGDFIVSATGEHYLIKSIASNTSAVVTAGITGATMTTVSSGGSYQLTEKPISVARSESTTTSGDSGNITKIYGVATNEMAAEADQGTPVPHAGWVRRTTGTGGRAGRTFTEVLVAGSSIAGDLEDVVMQEYNINITTQPSNDSSATGSAVTFAVVASTIPSGGSLTYQWQLDSGSGFGNISNGGVYSDATTATLAISDNTGLDGYEYRCVVSATGATSVTSDAATLTEAP